MVLFFAEHTRPTCHQKHYTTQASKPVILHSELANITSDSADVPKEFVSEFPKEPYRRYRLTLNSKMASYLVPLHQDYKDYNPNANPDVYTSAGLVANAYARFQTNFWLDRLLIWLTVVIPVLQATIIIVIHAVLGVARCVPRYAAEHENNRHSNDFTNRACGLQLTSDVLTGSKTITVGSSVELLKFIQLQHECYPFMLIVAAILLWIPHYLFHRAIDRTARRDLCLVRSEFHSFRKSVAQELTYLQATTATSLDGAANMFLSPGSTIPPSGPMVPHNCLRVQPGQPITNPAYAQAECNSGLTTAATIGENSGASHTPAPTVMHAQPPKTATLGMNHCGMLGTLENSPLVAQLSHNDADFSAPGLLDLPCFRACHADWSLNTYLSAWQNTNFYWRRYLAKHVVISVFLLGSMTTIFALVGMTGGAPFSALFACDLMQWGTTEHFTCLLQTTFIINMSIISLGFISLAGLTIQCLYFYFNFIHSFWRFGDHGQYFGVSNKFTFGIGLHETHRCFFADYIRLLAYTAFRDTQCEIRSLSVSYSPSLYSSDFHFVSLLCMENAQLIPDSIHIHFWTERYARLCRRRFRRPYWAIRRGSQGNLVRCEDLSLKFNFSKIKMKVEVNDFGF